MKKKILLMLAAALVCTTTMGQKVRIANRYSMDLVKNDDGTYALKHPKDYKFVNLDEVPDLLTYYKARPIAASKHYAQCVSEEYVYKTYPEYELKLIVDRAVSDEPAPFIVWIHGGGWTSGSNSAFSVSSQYIAVQKGIAGVRIAYTLSGQPHARIDVTMEDIADAVKWVQKHAKELNINPESFGFCGQSAGAHLSAAAAMSIKGSKAMVGYAGPYNLRKMDIAAPKNQRRKAYFYDLAPEMLKAYSPCYMVPRKHIPASLLFHGTGDRLVDYTQSEEYAEAIRRRGGEVELVIYPYYDHNLHGKRSDKANEILRMTADFFEQHLK